MELYTDPRPNCPIGCAYSRRWHHSLRPDNRSRVECVVIGEKTLNAETRSRCRIVRGRPELLVPRRSGRRESADHRQPPVRGDRLVRRLESLRSTATGGFRGRLGGQGSRADRGPGPDQLREELRSLHINGRNASLAGAWPCCDTISRSGASRLSVALSRGAARQVRSA